MTTDFQQTQILMANQYPRLHYSYSLYTLSCLITLIILIQGPIIIVAQSNQFESVIASNNINSRSSSTISTDLNNDDASYDAGAEIYDDNEDMEDMSSSAASSSSSSSTTSIVQSKITSNITSHIPVQPEQVPKNEYEDESSYLDETTNPDESEVFGDPMSANHPAIKPPNTKKDSDLTATSRIPFLPSNLWRDLFSKPGILVGIIGGIVIGMLSAILLVMFIIYRMRKKDEGSYALEEGPRKSPSHAYTRVSSREFFA